MTTIRIEVPVPMTAEKVWAVITDPAQRGAWVDGGYDIEPVEGGDVRIDLPDELLAPTWSRLLGASVPEVSGRRVFTSLDEAIALLRDARRVLLVSHIGDEVPRALLHAGLDALVKAGPGAEQWAVAQVDGEVIEFAARSTPVTPVDVVHLDVPTLFAEYLDVAVELEASTYWVHSARTRHPLPHDDRGTWFPDDVAVTQRTMVEARGLTYVDNVYIADAARGITRERARLAPRIGVSPPRSAACRRQRPLWRSPAAGTVGP